MERSQLINKWFNELNMSIQTESVKERFRLMIECLDDIELMRPFFVIENEHDKAKKGTRAIAKRYNVSRTIVQHQIKRSKLYASQKIVE